MDVREKMKELESNSKNSIIDVGAEIKKIKENKLTNQELTNCLDSKQLYIISNAIIKIIELNIVNNEVIEKLSHLSKYCSKQFVFADGIAIGHISLAALLLLNTKDSIHRFNEIYISFDKTQQDNTERAKEILKDLTNDSHM